jgi:hypothetical protein
MHKAILPYPGAFTWPVAIQKNKFNFTSSITSRAMLFALFCAFITIRSRVVKYV